MDAYSSYIIKLTDARVGELRKEAAEYALSSAARQRPGSLWSRARRRLSGARPPAVEPAAPVPLPVPERAPDLRRSA